MLRAKMAGPVEHRAISLLADGRLCYQSARGWKSGEVELVLCANSGFGKLIQ